MVTPRIKLLICPICGTRNITKGMYGKIHCMDCKKEIISLATTGDGMPLSKARDRARKQAKRDEIRLEGKKYTGFVQPTQSFELSDIMVGPSTEAESGYDLDADGSPIYEEA